MKCKFSDEECGFNSHNDKTCTNCLIVKQSVVLKRLEKKIDKFDKPKASTKKITKVTGRTKTATQK